jgi:hypothetical protein
MVLVYTCIFSLARVYVSWCIGARRLSFYRAGSRGVTVIVSEGTMGASVSGVYEAMGAPPGGFVASLDPTIPPST